MTLNPIPVVFLLLISISVIGMNRSVNHVYKFLNVGNFYEAISSYGSFFYWSVLFVEQTDEHTQAQKYHLQRCRRYLIVCFLSWFLSGLFTIYTEFFI
jgi:hypothetical protein